MEMCNLLELQHSRNTHQSMTDQVLPSPSVAPISTYTAVWYNARMTPDINICVCMLSGQTNQACRALWWECEWIGHLACGVGEALREFNPNNVSQHSFHPVSTY